MWCQNAGRPLNEAKNAVAQDVVLRDGEVLTIALVLLDIDPLAAPAFLLEEPFFAGIFKRQWKVEFSATAIRSKVAMVGFPLLACKAMSVVLLRPAFSARSCVFIFRLILSFFISVPIFIVDECLMSGQI